MQSRWTIERFPGTVLFGAAMGAALGCIGLLVGALRGVLLLFGGVQLSKITQADVRSFIIYIGGFALAGAFIGLVYPLLRGRRSIYVALAAGGAIAMNVIAVADHGLPGGGPVRWIGATFFGCLFGFALAHGFLRQP